MDAKFISIVERLVKEQGADTLIDAKKCKAHLADYANNEFKKERHLLLIAIEAGAAQAIANASDLTICKKQQMRYLKDDRFIDESAAAEAVDLLAFALRGDRNKSITVANSASSQSQYAPPTQSDYYQQPQYTPKSQHGQRSQYNLPPQQSSYATQSQTAPIAAQSTPRKKSGVGKFFAILGKSLLAIVVLGLLLWFVAYKTILSNADTAYYSENYRKAAELYELAFDLYPLPKDANIYYRIGLAFLKIDDKWEAKDYFSRAIRIDPKLADAYYYRAELYYEQESYRYAIDDYSEWLTFYHSDYSDIAYVYNKRGNAYYALKNYAKAITDYSEAIKLKPNVAVYYGNRGNVYSELGDYKKALADYAQAIKIDPKLAYIYNNRGDTYYELKNYSKAIADYTQAIKIDPNYARAYNQRGNTYYSMKSYSKAIADYTKAITINSDNAVYYDNRGDAYYALKNYSKAIADYTQAIKIDPKFARAYSNRGYAYLALRNRTNAINDAYKACELGSCELKDNLWRY
jgi:tetratricopeptide (TPR) repeat protein